MTDSEIAGDENRRKVMGSHLFGDPEKHPRVQPELTKNQNSGPPAAFFPKYSNPNPIQRNNNPEPVVQNTSYVPQYNGPVYVPNSRVIPPKIDVLPQPAPLPTLQPFPDFHFDSVKPPESFDLGVQPRQIQTKFTPQKLPLNSIDQMRKMREDIYRENTAFNDRFKNIMSSQQQQRNQFAYKNISKPPSSIPQQTSVQMPSIDTIGGPGFQTSTEFLMPDGTPFQE